MDKKKKRQLTKRKRREADKKKKRQTNKEHIVERDHRGIIFASLYTIIKKQNWSYLFIGAKSMPCHWSKKVLFWPYLSFGNKKSFLVGGG